MLRVFAPFALGYFLSYFYRVVNAVIAPNLVSDVGLDAGALGMLTSTYFLAFGLFQFPLGMLLDRYGPRRTEAGLLVFAAMGALVFARADGLVELTIGRALIGLGVSACLMAAFKAFVVWFPAPRLPLVNGLQMAAGGLGALAGTAPVELLLGVTDWRGVFTALAVCTFIAALAVFVLVPDPKHPRRSGDTGGLGGQLRGVTQVFGSPIFWRLAPWTVMSQASLLSIQGLWAGPWLRDVAGLDRDGVANTLALTAAAMIVGYVLLGALAERLGRRGVSPMRVAAAGMGVFMAVQVVLIAQWTAAVQPLWILFGFFGTTGIVPYAALSQSFPPHLAGRANTGLNLIVFLGAFAAQWSIGALIDLWPKTPADGYAAAGYRAAFLLMLVLQLAGLLWYLLRGRSPPSRHRDVGETK